MIELKEGDLRLVISRPGTYYQGTRFDHAGVFRMISKGGFVFADEWFDGNDPQTHDHVCGPSEEFVTVNFDGVAPGGTFVKPGVGLLRRPDDAPYDWFRLYEIADEGRRSESVSGHEAEFRQVLDGFYDYVKTIRILSDSSFGIYHRMTWLAEKPLEGYFYNHNFFTFSGAQTGPLRKVDFPFHPEGHWRSHYSSVSLNDRGICFTAEPDLPCVYMGDLHSADGSTPYAFRISEGSRAVEVRGSGNLDHLVFWANRRVACPEPYMPVGMKKGDTQHWHVTYGLI